MTAVLLAMMLQPLRAQEAKTKFIDLPEEFRKNVFPQLVEECKDCQ